MALILLNKKYWLTHFLIVVIIGVAGLIYLGRATYTGAPPLVDWMLWATPVIAALVAIVLLFALVAWLRGYWRFSGRLHYTCVLLAGLGFVWFLHYGNLLRLPT
ncbi:MAG: hypothetical protein IIA70_06855 [Proteobacteria bacterium]|nr:hypothetical protein [Pseudomonadota bacterium]